MTDTKQSAIEAAAKAVAGTYPLNQMQSAPGLGGAYEAVCRSAARAAILAYLNALVEDEETIEACRVAIEDHRDLVVKSVSSGIPMAETFSTRYARAALRTLATRAQGES